MKFDSDLRQVGGFLRVPRVSSTNKTDHHDKTEILLRVVLITIKQTNKQTNKRKCYDRHHDLINRYGISVLQMATYKYVSFVVIGIPHFPHS
jgi:hypothetical protein